MAIFFPVLLLFTVLLSTPAFLFARRKHAESRWLLFASFPAVTLWVILAATGFGAQSLSNLVELLFLAAASVVLIYVKVFALDGKFTIAPKSTYVVVILLLVVAVALRTFMPVLPE